MGQSDEDGGDNATPQQIYYRQLFHLQHYGPAEMLAEFETAGPPTPLASDGMTGKILWFEAHPPSVDEVAALLALMAAGGWITSTEAEHLAQLPQAECIAELKARMIERDSERRQPASGSE
ncbi:hypothetical protein ACLMAJ_19925 [Nocardia sp. KC 131]|uniref:hypothetical protein n=1 Tax=Nocardia arseniciresistens TaxID=3392119 RepID=UPI00398EAC80